MKRADVLIAVVLWAASYFIGTWYVGVFTTAGGQRDGALSEFGAAVSIACGRGFVDPRPDPGRPYTTALTQFLGGESDAITCGDVPAGPLAEPTFMQRLYRYLISAAALVWKLRGRISWSALLPLYGILYGCTIVAAYSIFRAAMRSPVVPVLASVALMVSSIHLSHLPLYRDYAKAPFILGLLAMMAWMARGAYRRNRLLGWAAAFGAVLGVGFGFRNDLLISVPPFLLVVFFWAGGPLTSNVKAKLAAVALAAAMFVIVSFPVLQGYAKGSNSGHAAVSGVMANMYDEPLAIRASIYDWAYLFRDEFTYTVLTSYAYRTHGVAPIYATREYDQTAVEYLMQIVRNSPADMVNRVYASTLVILEMPYTIGVYANAIPARGDVNGFVSGVYEWQTWFLRYPAGAGAVIAVAALTIAGMSSIWAALTLLAMLVYYAGYPVLQFQHRHYFHLEFIGWLALGFVVEQVARWLWSLAANWRRGALFSIEAKPLLRGLAFLVAMSAILVTVVTAARAYQQRHFGAMFTSYLNEPREQMQTSVSRADGVSLIASADVWATRASEVSRTPVSAQYVVAEFSGSSCGVTRLPVTFKYASAEKLNDFSRHMVMALERRPSESTRVFFPAYYYADASHFAGVEVPAGYETCLTSLSRVKASSTPPLLLDLTFAPDWQNARLFQTLSSVERDRRTRDAYFANPDDAVLTSRALDNATPETVNALVERVPIATQTGGDSWLIKGRVDIPTARLLRFKDRPVKRGTMLIVRGEARRGTFRMGLAQGAQWIRSVAVTSGGPFVAAVEAPDDGNMGIAVSADLTARWPAKYIGHRLGPWLEWLPGATLWSDLAIREIGLTDADDKTR